MIRIVLADDHTLVRHGIKSLLALVPDLELVAEASDGAETVAAVLSLRPDVLLLDMRMPKGDGLFVVRTLAEKNVLPPTLILTTFEDDDVAVEVVRAGARGFLLKDVSLDRLVRAVRAIAAGETLIQPALTERAQKELSAVKTPPESRAAPADDDITTREREVLRLLAAGYSNREIARALFVAEGTVKNHVSHILEKLGVRDRTRAVLRAAQLGYL